MGTARPQKKLLGTKELFSYSLGLFGFQLIVGYLNSYQAEFYVTAMKADLAVIGVLLLAVKILSAVFDPVVGNLIDRTKSAKGKLKPFILYSALPLMIMTVVIFIQVPLTGASLYIYIFFTFLLFSMAMTLGDVPSQAIAAVATPDPTERTNLVSVANTFKAVGLSAAAAVIPVVCLLVPGGSSVITQNGAPDTPISVSEYLVTAIVIAAAGCLLFMLIYFFNKERVPYKAEKMTFKDMLAVLKGNKPFMLVILSCFLGFGRQIQTGIAVQTANSVLNSQNLVLLLGLTGGIGAVISMALIPVLVKKFGEKRVYISLSLYGFAISMLTFFLGYKSLPVMLVFLFFTGFQFGVVDILPMIMTADSVDYYEYKTGKRAEGTIYAVLSLTVKVTIAMGTALGLIILSAAKYDAVALKQDATTANVVYFAYAAVPGIFSLLSVIPILKYDLSGSKKLEIAAELQKRREASSL
ncbi:MAG: glycoside-pentoside-hexuronide (GPH):cation symporter [Clostridiales bacterium]|jgi:GPH family glycoside/pentoside/hexuronide:cation symporter/probable glucitol transport protein GutA|nr:glycoside-pentoside-hexuronide (GPH):cation symporter [Clostridiales bacterium]